jgi:alanine dehydrogenase
MSDIHLNPFQELLSQQGLAPLEAMSWTKQNATSIRIGLPMEVSVHENRIALSPEAVKLLVLNGHEIVIESNAGVRAGFSDSDYILAGASITNDPSKIWGSEVVLKIAAPTLLELEFCQPEICLISCANYQALSAKLIDKINQKRLMAIGLEYVEDNGGGLPFVRMMAEIAGQLILPIASNILSSQLIAGTLLGNVTGVPPINIVLLGSGQVVEQVSKAAWHAGIQVQVFDKDIYKLQRLKQNLGFPLITQVIDSENLAYALQNAQVIVGALRSENGITPCIVTEEMVSNLKPGTLIIDVCIDQGGCLETSETTNLSNPTYSKYDIIHYCVPNIASKVAKTASLAMSNLLASFVLKTGKTGGIDEMLWQGKSFMKGIYCYKGHVTQKNIGRLFHKPVKDIQLLLLSKS